MPESAFSLDHLPVLSAGRHRSAKRGACFMEYASFLAGERWSDHPSCTHPALACLARAVNDCTRDAGRSAIAPLIPSVIGLNEPGERIDVLVAVRAGCAALPVASESRQRTIAVGILHARLLLDRFAFGAPSLEYLRPVIDAALATAPAATSWARTFSAGVTPRPANAQHAMQVLTTVSVLGIAEACVNDSDARLASLLTVAIADCERLLEREPSIVGEVPASRKSDRAFANA